VEAAPIHTAFSGKSVEAVDGKRVVKRSWSKEREERGKSAWHRAAARGPGDTPLFFGCVANKELQVTCFWMCGKHRSYGRIFRMCGKEKTYGDRGTGQARIKFGVHGRG